MSASALYKPSALKIMRESAENWRADGTEMAAHCAEVADDLELAADLLEEHKLNRPIFAPDASEAPEPPLDKDAPSAPSGALPGDTDTSPVLSPGGAQVHSAPPGEGVFICTRCLTDLKINPPPSFATSDELAAHVHGAHLAVYLVEEAV